MWNRVKKAFNKAEARRRSQVELDRLFQQGDHVFRDIGVSRADVARARQELNFL
jgi:uncharacterized protein YjiS (DUF1127 family)